MRLGLCSRCSWLALHLTGTALLQGGCLPSLTWMGGCMAAIDWSIEVKADMADISTSSLTRIFPWTSVWVRGDWGTVMYVDTCNRHMQTIRAPITSLNSIYSFPIVAVQRKQRTPLTGCKSITRNTLTHTHTLKTSLYVILIRVIYLVINQVMIYIMNIATGRTQPWTGSIAKCTLTPRQTYIQCGQSSSVSCMFLDCGTKPKDPVKAHTLTRRTRELHTQSRGMRKQHYPHWYSAQH